MKSNILVVAAIGVCAVALCFTPRARAGAERFSKEVAPAPIVEEPFSWTGFYIGGNLGGNWSNYHFGDYITHVDMIDQFNDANTGGPFIFHPTAVESDGGFEGDADINTDRQEAPTGSGFIGGGQVGFQKQWGHFVVGLEGDFDRATSKSSSTFEGSDNDNLLTDGNGVAGISPFTATAHLTSIRRADIDWTASGRGKVGWANGHVLLYVTGGAAWANVNVWADDRVTTDFFFSEGGPPGLIGSKTDSNISKNDDTVFGWTAGGGGELAINDMFSIGMEYRHSNYGDHTYQFSSNGGVITPGATNVSMENDMVVVKFNILLNHFFGH